MTVASRLARSSMSMTVCRSARIYLCANHSDKRWPFEMVNAEQTQSTSHRVYRLNKRTGVSTQLLFKVGVHKLVNRLLTHTLTTVLQTLNVFLKYTLPGEA